MQELSAQEAREMAIEHNKELVEDTVRVTLYYIKIQAEHGLRKAKIRYDKALPDSESPFGVADSTYRHIRENVEVQERLTALGYQIAFNQTDNYVVICW